MTVKHSQSKAKQNETTSSSPKKNKKRKQMGTATKKYTKTVGKPECFTAYEPCAGTGV